jgi:hypothetical protein
MTYEITYFHIISLIYNAYFVKLSISLQDLGVTVLTAQHWHSALVVTDPPHIRRVGFCLYPLFKKAGLSYWLIQSDAPTWHANRWWQDDRWRGFSLLEVVKLIFYAVVYGF